MRRSALTFLAALALVLTTLGAALGAAADAPVGTDLPPGWEPRPRTIVAVTGDPANGFSITRYDGSEEHTTTWSETVAECGEYDRRVARVRCRAENRGRYRALRGTVSALRHYQWHAGGGADR